MISAFSDREPVGAPYPWGTNSGYVMSGLPSGEGRVHIGKVGRGDWENKISFSSSKTSAIHKVGGQVPNRESGTR